jgi:hypothetical protein
MVVATIRLGIAREGRDQRAVSWGYPIQDGALHTLSVIRPRIGNTLLNLQ